MSAGWGGIRRARPSPEEIEGGLLLPRDSDRGVRGAFFPHLLEKGREEEEGFSCAGEFRL